MSNILIAVIALKLHTLRNVLVHSDNKDDDDDVFYTVPNPQCNTREDYSSSNQEVMVAHRIEQRTTKRQTFH
jgi:hypothetical protein